MIKYKILTLIILFAFGQIAYSCFKGTFTYPLNTGERKKGSFANLRAESERLKLDLMIIPSRELGATFYNKKL